MKGAAVLVSALCIFLGIWVNGARRQRIAVEDIKRLGGFVGYECYYDSDRDFVTNRGLHELPQHMVPTWLTDYLGMDMFSSVIYVGFDSDTTNDDLTHVCDLPQLEAIYLNHCRITDAAVPKFLDLKQLRVIFAINTELSAMGAARISAEIPSCQVWCGPESDYPST